MSIDLTRTPNYAIKKELHEQLKTIGYDSLEVPTIVKTILWFKKKGIDTSYNDEEKEALRALFETQKRRFTLFNLAEVTGENNREASKMRKGTTIIDNRMIKRLIEEYIKRQ